MRLHCPICGERDRREFYYQGAAVMLERPGPDAGAAAWDDYLHLRDNTAGDLDELWSHDAGCGAWLRVTRNVSTHEIKTVVLAREIKR
ncbi:sarcosine oxidase subunit delta [Tateyamaria omphalii]|uniref:sarcosine oxidase subunit delta n=1 Tax=Tateyamaria omphalii TaxID=299262 RepID=UPI0016789D11|nr:sarcosine oxidase subunit delta [Tateyamaria omphalii]GGX53028.1 sarcosine oxidase subunit delta [Tateyamaria omphalii]